jgi:excisionase family DNA binding protein
MLVKLKDAAKELGLTVWTLRRHIRAGKIPAYRLGGLVMVDMDKVLGALTPYEPRLKPQAGAEPASEQKPKSPSRSRSTGKGR